MDAGEEESNPHLYGVDRLQDSIREKLFPISGGSIAGTISRCPDELAEFEQRTWDYNMRRQMQEIVPGLFLGPYGAAGKAEKENLLKNGVTGIVCVRSEAEARLIKPNFPQDFAYLIRTINDSRTEMIIPHFAPVIEFIGKTLAAGGKVLVHDDAGISRAPTLVVAYVMYRYGIESNLAIRIVQSRRFCIFPIDNFRAQLLEYEPLMLAQRQISTLTSDQNSPDMRRELSNLIHSDSPKNQNPNPKRCLEEEMDADGREEEDEHVSKCSAMDEDHLLAHMEDEEANPRIEHLKNMLV